MQEAKTSKDLHIPEHFKVSKYPWTGSGANCKCLNYLKSIEIQHDIAYASRRLTWVNAYSSWYMNGSYASLKNIIVLAYHDVDAIWVDVSEITSLEMYFT